MIAAEWKAMKTASLEHAEKPEAGDYWSDHFCPVLVVVGVIAGQVLFCETTQSTDPGHWTWNLGKLALLPLPAFKKKLMYDSMPKTWAECNPRGHAWVVEAVKEFDGTELETEAQSEAK